MAKEIGKQFENKPDSLESSRSLPLGLESTHVDRNDRVVFIPEGSLCERCLNINIDTLSAKQGYEHLRLKELKESAENCELCCAFFRSFARDWSLEDHHLSLSLRCKPNKGSFPDHSKSNVLNKCIWVSVFNTRKLVRGKPMLCYTEEGDHAAFMGVPWLRTVGDHTGSSSSLRIAKGWLDQCLALKEEGIRHNTRIPDAPASSIAGSTQEELEASILPTERPTRLLEIFHRDDLNSSRHSVRLIETNDEDFIYATLSYCWGKIAGTWLTTKDTIEQYSREIDPDSLPTTINDALLIAPALNINYVWVDSLCIIQDSELDWEVESAKMGGIYRGGRLTIAASRSANSSEGCFNGRKTSIHNPFDDYIRVTSRLKNGYISSLYFEKRPSRMEPEIGAFGTEVQRSPLSRRAWVYQEEVLSKRTLYFAESQLYWECDHCRLSEDNSQQAQTGRAYPVLSLGPTRFLEDIITRWYHDAVDTYSQRGLTKSDDRLVAISAVAKATYLNRRVGYVAGLWQGSIIKGLCWYRTGPGQKNKAFLCPSWSWASQLSGVSYRLARSVFQDQGIDVSTTIPKVLGIQLKTDEKNPFGKVTSGRIQLHATVAEGVITYKPTGEVNVGSGFYPHIDEKALLIPDKTGCNIWRGDAVLDNDEDTEKKVLVAFLSDWDDTMAKWKLLLLEEDCKNEQTYRRVGLGVMGQDYLTWSGVYASTEFRQNWTRKVITLV